MEVVMAIKKIRGLSNYRLFGYWMCLPALILFSVFVIYPLFKGFYISLNQWDGFSAMRWNGFKNYVFVFEDPVFWQALKNTFIYAIVSPVLKNIVGLIVAMIFVQRIAGSYFFRVCTYIPYTFSYVIVGVLFGWIYNPTFGLLNNFLTAIGAEGLIRGWLSDPDIALFSVIMVDVWKCMGFHGVLFMAGLNAIPQELYEAADIDGAGTLKKFWHITLPQLNSTLVTGFLLAMTGAFVNNYDVVNVMTGGGPFHSTEVAIYTIMTTAFRYSNMGKANAMSTILVIFVAIVGFVQLKAMTRDENYE